MLAWRNWLARSTVNREVEGSSPSVSVVLNKTLKYSNYKALWRSWSNALDLRSGPLLRAQVRILLVLFALLAQMVEHTTFNRRVTGSSPVQGLS